MRCAWKAERPLPPDQGWFSTDLCSNQCAIYQDTALCYAGSTLVDVTDVADDPHLSPCTWATAPVDGNAAFNEHD